MKTIPTIILLLILCYGNSNAQSFIETTSSNKEKTANQVQPHNSPMPPWQKDWSKESVIAITEIIEEYGYPDENSPNRMYWIISGEIKRTITYTENILFDLPCDTNSYNIDSVAITKNHL